MSCQLSESVTLGEGGGNCPTESSADLRGCLVVMVSLFSTGCCPMFTCADGQELAVQLKNRGLTSQSPCDSSLLGALYECVKKFATNDLANMEKKIWKK